MKLVAECCVLYVILNGLLVTCNNDLKCFDFLGVVMVHGVVVWNLLLCCCIMDNLHVSYHYAIFVCWIFVANLKKCYSLYNNIIMFWSTSIMQFGREIRVHFALWDVRDEMCESER